MLRMLTARTTEVDYVDEAVEDIFTQLGIGHDGKGLDRNSAGLIFCSPDFVDSGVVAELGGRLSALGCHVIGSSTMANSARGGHDMYSLSIAVFTGDDVEFAAAITGVTDGENAVPEIERVYGDALSRMATPPKMIITFFPYVENINNSSVLSHFDQICGGIPIWGSVVCDMTMSFEQCRVIKDDQAFREAYAMLLIGGNVEPSFFISSVPLRNIHDRVATVTDSDGYIIKKIDGLPAGDYFSRAGIIINIQADSASIPLMVDYGDGSVPVALGFYKIDKNGAIYCSGEVPVGARFAVGEIDSEGIIETAQRTIDEAVLNRKNRNLLVVPCVSRYIMLTPENDLEASIVEAAIASAAPGVDAPDIPYIMGYSGGEICPLPDRENKLRNRFHNYTFTVCAI